MNRFVKYFEHFEQEEKYWHLYGMVESIRPVRTDYTIIKNSDTIDINFYDSYTKETYKVLMKKYSPSRAEIIFGEISQFNLDNATPEDLKTAGNKPFKVLGQVMFIITDILKKRDDIKYVYFTAFGKDLEKVYKKMVQNKYFIKTLNDIGYEYIGYKHKEFSFKKII